MVYTKFLFLIFLCSVTVLGTELYAEWRSIEGEDSNGDPSLGMAGSAMIRETDNKGIAPRYKDGSAPDYDGFPNPRIITNTLMKQNDEVFDERGVTDHATFWGQFLAHEISLTETNRAEPLPFAIPGNDPDFPAGTTVQMFRSRALPGTGDSQRNPRIISNGVSSFIDGSVIYGMNQERADLVREFVDGKLSTSDGNLMPLDNGGPNFLAGDPRANENFALLATHTLFVREHNRLAALIKQKRPGWNDETIYQAARKIVGAMLQAVTYNEYLPALGLSLPMYRGFKPDVDPSGLVEVLTTGFRLGHTQSPSHRLLIDGDGHQSFVPLLDTFFNPEGFTSDILDDLFRGGAFLPAQKIDLLMQDSVRNIKIINPAFSIFIDLPGIDIQRERDRGMHDYNTVREAYGLRKMTRFSQITSDKEISQRLQEVFGTIEKVSLFAGMLAEPHLNGKSFGATIDALLKTQFTRLRDGDRFFYLNDPSFKPGGDLAIIGFGIPFLEGRKYSDIIIDNSGIKKGEIPIYIFRSMTKNEFQKFHKSRVIATARALILEMNYAKKRANEAKKSKNENQYSYWTSQFQTLKNKIKAVLKELS